MKKIFLIAFIFFFFPLMSSAKEAPLNVIFTIDNNYPVMTMITIESILDHNWSNSDYIFYVIENNITNKNKKMMRDFVEKRNQQIEFLHVDTNKLDKNGDLFDFSNRITSIACARILIPELLPKTAHKALYMDSDIIVTRDLKDLYKTNLKNKSAGMILNHDQKNGAEKLYKFRHGYYNSGVILFNLDACRKNNTSKRMLAFLDKNREKFISKDKKNYDNKWKFPDQDLINVVWDNEIKTIPTNWNNQCVNGACQLYVYKNEGIIHYLGSEKPWDYAERYKYTDQHQIYYAFLKKPELKKYRYYFALRKIYLNYKELQEKKIKRYKQLKKLVFQKKKSDRLFLIYYVPSKEKR